MLLFVSIVLHVALSAQKLHDQHPEAVVTQNPVMMPQCDG